MRTMFIGVLLAAGCAEDAVGTVSQPAIATNAIATNAIATNAIATNAIATNAIATNAIATNAIATNAILKTALEDPNARIFMQYLVGCALPAGASVQWTSRAGQIEEFPGLLGLCPAWESGAPDQLCRERVSACILARNNSFGFSVQFSMRGAQDDKDPIKLGQQVPPHDHIFGTSKVVPSTEPCTYAYKGAKRDCGWTVAAIGMCEPKQPVSIATGNYAACNGSFLGNPGKGDNMLRVCAGTHACDFNTAIASVDNACGALDPGIDFTCPRNGYYAVMVAASDPRDTPDGDVGSTMLDQAACREAACWDDETCCGGWGPHCERSCTYPASEANVFRWGEGSFYGDLFGGLDPGKPEVRVNPETLHVESWDGTKWIDDNGALSQAFVGVVYPQMHSCASSNWNEPVAYMQYRACAGPDPVMPGHSKNCAARYEGRCADQCYELDAGPIYHDFDAKYCFGADGRVFEQPMTTFLSGPCDAVPIFPWCSTVQPTPNLPW